MLMKAIYRVVDQNLLILQHAAKQVQILMIKIIHAMLKKGKIIEVLTGSRTENPIFQLMKRIQLG